MVTPDDNAAAIAALQAELTALTLQLGAPVQGSCSAEYPHPDKLIFRRGPNTYRCTEDGNIYRKDGQGGLVDVV